MSELLSDYKLKCKHHRNFNDGIPNLGFGINTHPAAGGAAILYLPLFIRYLPRVLGNLWHSLVSCPDNPHWRYVEQWQAKNEPKITYEQYLRQEEIEIAQNKTKAQTII